MDRQPIDVLPVAFVPEFTGHSPMGKDFFIITADAELGKSLKNMLPEELYNACVVDAFQFIIEKVPASATCFTAIDIDTFEPNYLEIRRIKRQFPNMHLLALSERNFHPEYTDVLSNYFFACLSKPIDINELLYLIRGL